MKLTANGAYIEGVKREPIPGGTNIVPRFIVVHFTSGATAQSSIDYWRTPEAKGASAQIIIDRDGTPIQCRAFNRSAGHAGPDSKWRGTRGLNSCSIGIELANAGDDTKLARRWSKLPLLTCAHKHETRQKEWEQYTPEQLETVTKLCLLLKEAFPLIEDIIGHEDCRKGEKNDPGPAFPMRALREVCGFKGEPKE